MKDVAKLLEILWEIINKKKNIKANVTNKETEIIVSILKGKRCKRFISNNIDDLISNLQKSYC